MPAVPPSPPSTMAPKIATTSEENSARKKLAAPVAMPICERATAFCSATVETGNTVPRPEPITTISTSTIHSGISPGQIASGPSARIEHGQPDQRHALVVRHMRHQPAGDGRGHNRRRPSAGSARGRTGSPSDASPLRNTAARRWSCRPSFPCCRRRPTPRSAPPDCPARSAAGTAPRAVISRQANRPHSTADANSSAPISGEIQS